MQLKKNYVKFGMSVLREPYEVWLGVSGTGGDGSAMERVPGTSSNHLQADALLKRTVRSAGFGKN